MDNYINAERAIRDLKELTKKLTGKQLAIAVSRGINSSLQKGRTTARQAVKDAYNIPQKNLSGININKSFPSTQTGSIYASARPIPMDAFSPKFQTKTQTVTVSRKGVQKAKDRSRKSKDIGMGVSIEVKKGQRETVPFAFMLVGQKPRVFARGEYRSNFGFKQRHTRLSNEQGNDSVKPLVSITIHAAVINPETIGKIKSKLNNAITGDLRHEVQRLIDTLPR